MSIHEHTAYDGDPRIPLLNISVPKTSSPSKNFSLLLQDWWLWELLSALLAVLAVTAIIVILVLYDGSPLPDWPSVITVWHEPIVPNSQLPLRPDLAQFCDFLSRSHMQTSLHDDRWRFHLPVEMALVSAKQASSFAGFSAL